MQGQEKHKHSNTISFTAHLLMCVYIFFYIGGLCLSAATSPWLFFKFSDSLNHSTNLPPPKHSAAFHFQDTLRVMRPSLISTLSLSHGGSLKFCTLTHQIINQPLIHMFSSCFFCFFITVAGELSFDKVQRRSLVS